MILLRDRRYDEMSAGRGGESFRAAA
jgi:hypothetical protein